MPKTHPTDALRAQSIGDCANRQQLVEYLERAYGIEDADRMLDEAMTGDGWGEDIVDPRGWLEERLGPPRRASIGGTSKPL